MEEMILGDLHVAPTGRTVGVKGQSATKTDDLRGTGELFCVRSYEWELTLARNRWDNGEQDVVLHDRGTAPQRFDRFRSARRLGLTPVRNRDEYSVELMQAQMGENDHPTLRKVDLTELSEVAGCDVLALLTKMGARVGTRSELVRDMSRNGSRYCARFPCHATEVAVVAYVITRIAPFHREIRA